MDLSPVSYTHLDVYKRQGTLASDDISLRISADADGEAALATALHFAHTLSASIGR